MRYLASGKSSSSTSTIGCSHCDMLLFVVLLLSPLLKIYFFRWSIPKGYKIQLTLHLARLNQLEIGPSRHSIICGKPIPFPPLWCVPLSSTSSDFSCAGVCVCARAFFLVWYVFSGPPGDFTTVTAGSPGWSREDQPCV